ncbi:aminoacyl-tRNA hydrolase [Candidatus Clavichlamydia salmonicola]|uniref:aminoacyl-tRNA hydrolase n=1 Tax=Candidatus Clavichlamydia salmonicola TaxID=469812 RepID=UPI00189195B0|nr:aminoacyl-tRNA hydrolase [Candidatus Clavichlamydia salmonicola]
MKLRLLIGLGNPGDSYKFHRHNIGFLILDELAERFSLSFLKDRSAKSLLAKGVIQEQSVLLLKPQTYMNDSGFAVKHIKEFYKVSVSDIMVVADELYIPFGELRFREQGGTAGHNGLKSIRDVLHTNEYSRLSMGLGLFEKENQLPKDEFVVTDFGPKEKIGLDALKKKATDALLSWLLFGPKGIKEFLMEKKE